MIKRYISGNTVIPMAILLLAGLCTVPLCAQEASDTTGEAEAPEAETAAETEESGEETGEETEPAVDTRELTLRYGIDTEVLGVLSDLRGESLDSYNDLLLEVLADSRNRDIDMAIYGIWSDTEWDGGLATASREVNKVLEDEDYEIKTVQSAIAYISALNYTEALPGLAELSGSRETKLAASAVRAIGRMADEPVPEGVEAFDSGAALLERLEDEDPVAEDDLVASLITTLGQIEYAPAASELVMIVDDEGSPAGHRRLACIAIGRIGREEDYIIIENLYFEADDATLRSYALAGLAEFEGRDSTDVLIQALKRDSFWRIRLTAAEKLGEAEIAEAADILKYKAEHDPVNQVKMASMKALGNIGGGENGDFLIDYYTDENKGTDVRLAALAVLVEHQIPGTGDAVSSVMDELWEEDKGRFLEFTCRDLSRSDWDELAPVFERMLDHSSWLLQVYGVRGIRRNDISSLQGRVDSLDSEGVDGRVRREITAGVK